MATSLKRISFHLTWKHILKHVNLLNYGLTSVLFGIETNYDYLETDSAFLVFTITMEHCVLYTNVVH